MRGKIKCSPSPLPSPIKGEGKDGYFSLFDGGEPVTKDCLIYFRDGGFADDGFYDFSIGELLI